MKRIFTISGLLLLFFFFSNAAFAQNATIKGKVTDSSTGQPLVGVTVGVRSLGLGTQTDVDGAYSVSIPANATLSFSYVGYTTQSVALNGRTTINIALTEQVNSLQGVVVIGYGTQRKIDNTGAVSTVKGEEISKQSSQNAISALQGKVAGVSIVNNGMPGAAPTIKIRGTGSIYGSNVPLYVVDGVWYNDINFLNPQDIENISVLKDASSTAIYGDRASNGVVIVTTKRGKKGQTTVNYNGYVGFQQVTHQVKLANATEYATLINELSVSNGAAPLFVNPAGYGTGTDWAKQILRNAFVTNHQVSVNGGTEKSDYNLSIGLLDQDGNVKGNNYKRYTLSLNNNYTPVKNLDLGVRVNGLYSTSHDIPNTTIFGQIYGAGPVLPVYNADGTYGDPTKIQNGSAGTVNLGGGNGYNPQVTLDFFNQTTQVYDFTGSTYAQLTFLKHFKFKTSFGGEYKNGTTLNYLPLYKATVNQNTTQSTLTRTTLDNRSWIAENTLTYDNQFGDHHLTVLLGQGAQFYQGYGVVLTANNVPDGSQNAYFSLGNNYSIVDNNSDNSNKNTLSSLFARLNYSFKDKYLLNASIRRDGASQLYPNPYANLPAVGAGWVITKEDFMKDQHVFDLLKLRASYGQVANSALPYNFSRLVTTTNQSLIANFGNPNAQFIGTNINTPVPPVTVLERATGYDFGLEGSMFNNRVSFELDAYNRETKDAIFTLPLSLSLGLNGGANGLVGNQANIRNRGLEASVTYRNSDQQAFRYSISGNIGYNQNKVLNVLSGLNPIYAGGGGLANGSQATRTRAGDPIGVYYGYKVAGIFQNAADVTSSAQAATAKPGDFKYVDVNGDGQINGNDRVIIGNPNPKYNYGINTSFNYKNFDLALDFQGVAGVDVYNAVLGYRFGNENFTKDFYDHRWHGDGTSNTYPSANIGKNSNAAPNSFYVESGAYFRLRNAQLGYNITSATLSKYKIQKVRFFANAQNPINIFGYRGFTPEIGGGPLAQGIDTSVYPIFAVYNFGVNVTF